MLRNVAIDLRRNTQYDERIRQVWLEGFTPYRIWVTLVTEGAKISSNLVYRRVRGLEEKITTEKRSGTNLK